MAAPVRLALVGCGGISGAHTAGYKDLIARGCREFEVTACCDVLIDCAERRADEIAAFQGARPRVFGSVDELLRADLAEAADVCTPHCYHHSTAIPLLQHGLHVLCEKPLGITIKASKKIIEAADKAGVVLATAENARRSPTSRACVWALRDAKLIGDVRLAVVTYLANQPFDYTNYAMKWRGVSLLTGGGMIMDSGAHFADMQTLMFGQVDEVNCQWDVFDRRPILDAPVVGDTHADVEDTWTVVIRFASGMRTVWTYGRSFVGDRVEFGHYYGSAGTMYDLGFKFHCFQGGGEALLADGTRLSSEELQSRYLATLSEADKARLFPYGCTDSMGIEVWDYIDSIRSGRKPEMDGWDGLRAKALCEACFESGMAGAPVKVQDVIDGRVSAFQRRFDDYWGI
ncbi:MAG: Gfo/Idh/MocA family oxidoreductase [Chloroflexi bacterium]|nr:Gfo/Idh/MocA family oxidoreductase [Chloroflexota bacterium]